MTGLALGTAESGRHGLFSGAAKITLNASNQVSMYRILVILLLCALGSAQTVPPSAPSQPAVPKPTASLNDSDNGRKARAVLDQTIQALGGQTYLAYEIKEETIRYYLFYYRHSESTVQPYTYY